MGRTKAAKKPKQPTKTMLQVQHNKKALLEALEKSLGVVTTACKAVGVDRTMHYRYLNEDGAYAAAVAELSEVAVDFAESKLHQQIGKGDTTATIFYLKTKGKHRGYVEKSEVGVTGEINVNHTGEIAFAKALAKIYDVSTEEIDRQTGIKGYIDGSSDNFS